MILGSVRESADSVRLAAENTDHLVAQVVELAEGASDALEDTRKDVAETLRAVRRAADAHASAMIELRDVATSIALIIGGMALIWASREALKVFRS